MGHPSDNLGGILAVADWLSRNAVAVGAKPLPMKTVLEAMVKAHEIQGCLALENSFNKVGLDHVILVKVASTAVVGWLLGLTREELINAVVPRLGRRTFPAHLPPCAEYRKPQELGRRRRDEPRGAPCPDRETGEMGYPSVLTAPVWGFYDVLFKGQAFRFQRPYGSYVMENVLFKISFLAEFHAQTAVEAAMTIHERPGELGAPSTTSGRSRSAPRKRASGSSTRRPLHNPADRDHCIQYMVAVPLVFGRLTAADYEDAVAGDPRIDALRERIEAEDPQFTRDYHDPDKRSIANALTVEFTDGSRSTRCIIRSACAAASEGILGPGAEIR